MRVRSISFRSFRSLSYLPIKAKPLNILVGANNAGKTNILKAMRYLFQPDYNPTLNDFPSFLKRKFISVEAELESLSPEWKNNFPAYIPGNRCTLKRRSSFHEVKPQYWINGYALSTDQLSVLKSLLDGYFVYIPVIRDIEGELEMGSRVYTKLMHQVRTGFKGYQREDFEDGIRRATLGLNRLIRRQTSDVLGALKSNLEGSNVEFAVKPSIEQVIREISISVIQRGGELPLENTGQGYQSLAILALYRALAERTKKECLYAIEEPELHLHPHLICFAMEYIRHIADHNIVFLTTHSSTIVENARLSELIRVSILDGRTQLMSCGNIEKGQELKLEIKILGGKTKIFFSKAVVLCEDTGAAITLPIWSSKLLGNPSGLLTYDFNKLGIGVVEVGGTEWKPYIDILKMFDIPFIMVSDEKQWTDRIVFDVLDKTELGRLYPRSLNSLKLLYSVNNKLTDDIINRLGKFRWFCFNGEYEGLYIHDGALKTLSKIFKECIPGKFKEVAKGRRRLQDITAAIEVAKNKKVLAATAAAMELEGKEMSNSLRNLLHRIVWYFRPLLRRME